MSAGSSVCSDPGVEHQLVPATIHQALAAVSGLKEGRSRARESEPVHPVSATDVEAVLPALSDVVRAMVMLQRLTGCRPGEICILRPIDVDRSRDVWCYRPATHKTEHRNIERRIYIGRKAQKVLRPFLNRPAEAFCFDPREAVAADRQLAAETRTQAQKARRPRAGRRGERYTKDSFRRAVVRACERVGLTPWSPNRLRHSRASEIRAHFDLEASQTVLGHKKADVSEIYAERDFKRCRVRSCVRWVDFRSAEIGHGQPSTVQQGGSSDSKSRPTLVFVVLWRNLSFQGSEKQRDQGNCVRNPVWE